MAISPTLLLSLLLFTTFLSVSLHHSTADPDSDSDSESSDLVTELLYLQSQSKSGVIHLNDHIVSRFLTSTKTPRPYSLLIFFDAKHLHSKTELHLQDLHTEFSLLSSSFISNNDASSASSLFFCDIEFKESQNSFSLFGVNSLPSHPTCRGLMSRIRRIQSRWTKVIFRGWRNQWRSLLNPGQN
ncbi:hypothetical protein OIU76_026028 [Salix suchowensis]|nr:hypothetical protein OIU76_026028 [Salix suchowensis]